ncbi:relaxase/mobilization nuclease domain-containing protein [uncultured Ruegeria sp.]|uniref:relaxase/mobilization nuclease domain-containing protein n=1 Tax=uncultured Ruegeria sp. TaxID=259304 RepID=UPI0026348BB3|nr:relaxase/mobilization nuclease domain-containing protein [uncultured Ruegeria sp.]
MLIKFFPNGKGVGAGPVGYLVAERVLAFDSNRDLIRDAEGQPRTVARNPLPEILRGDPSRTEVLIDASRHQWTYRAGVISFAAQDAPRETQQAEVMDTFERLAFAGLDGEQYDMLWVRHSHEDRVELHFCTPRLELTTGRSLNIAPPGYQDAYDSLRDLMNQRHGWADPMELERAQEVRDTIEAPNRAQGRDELHAWILDQISMGLIEDRASMIEALTDAGFDLPRAGKSYLTAQEPESGERWRLKGEIFHEDWRADPAERETERGAGHDTPRLRRLDDGRELVLDGSADTFRADGTGPDADRPGGTDLADAGPRPDRAEDLHDGWDAGHLHQDRGEMNDRPLTALERDLLACFERLVTACETSAKELSGLEARSTKRLQAQLDGIAACTTLLIRSQIASMRALRGLLNEEATYNALDTKLNESLSLVKAAEEKLKQS